MATQAELTQQIADLTGEAQVGQPLSDESAAKITKLKLWAFAELSQNNIYDQAIADEVDDWVLLPLANYVATYAGVSQGLAQDPAMRMAAEQAIRRGKQAGYTAPVLAADYF